MKSTQFFHIETYKQKSEAKKKKNNSDVKETHYKGVLNEAKREKGFCSHVEEPTAPTLLYGVGVEAVESLVSDYISDFRMKNGKGVERKIRKDSAVLLAGVISLDREDEAIWNDYKKASVEFLKAKYKDRLKSIIEHTDEANPHLHFYVVANSNELVNDLHDGKKATAEIVKYNRKNKDNKVSQQEAYSKAMIALQDDFYFSVSKKFGLDRTGEKPRSRLSRPDYKALEKERLNKVDIVNDLKKLASNLDQEIKSEIKKAGNIAYNKTLKEFRNKNYFQKIVFSLDFQKRKIVELESQNKDLKKRYKIVLKRKNHYKNEALQKEDFENKYINLRKDFNKRVDRKLEYKEKEVLKSQYDLKQIKLENEYLKDDLKDLQERAEYAFSFLEKAKIFLGKQFESFKNDIFKKPDHQYTNTENKKLKT